MNRIIRCTIEMELIEGEHFNALLNDLTDAQAEDYAAANFLDMITTMEVEDVSEYIQTKIIEDIP